MPSVNNNDVRIYYEDTGAVTGDTNTLDTGGGSGNALVFAHGFTLDRRMWAGQAAYFSSNYRVVAFDSRGHGKSNAPLTGYSRDHRETDLLAVVDELGLEKFHLIGLSMGGATAVGFAIDYPQRLESLVLVSSGVTAYNPSGAQDELTKLAKEKGIEAAREKWLEMIMGYHRRKPGPTADLIETMIRDHSGGPWRDPNRGKYDHRNDLELLRSLRLPTLILVGALDLNFVPMGEQLNDAIDGSTLQIIPEAGHLLNLEMPDEFNARLERWVTEGA
ncbi:MAG: alpha/beta fold hydrolase [Candidatus Zixiibacteriota bacterium]